MVFYEWTIEYGDDLNTNVDYRRTYKDAILVRDSNMDGNDFSEVVLVRQVMDGGCLVDRTWGYIRDNELPEFFEDSYQRDATRVPKRFHTEVSKVDISD